jgi:hypothetical protein
MTCKTAPLDNLSSPYGLLYLSSCFLNIYSTGAVLALLPKSGEIVVRGLIDREDLVEVFEDLGGERRDRTALQSSVGLGTFDFCQRCFLRFCVFYGS